MYELTVDVEEHGGVINGESKVHPLVITKVEIGPIAKISASTIS